MMQLVTANRRMALTSESVWLCLIIGLGGALRLYGLDFQSLWNDEGLQYYVATQNSLSELFYQTRSFHPPLSFIINHVFLLIGDSDFLLRLPSALFGIASLPVLYVLARDLTSKREATLAVLVLAISPFHIWYSQEGRMYSQLLFLSLLSSVLLVQALSSGKSFWWIGYISAGAAGMYTHVFMALTLTAQFLWILFYYRRRLLPITASVIAVALLFLPWTLLLPWVSGFVSSVGKAGLTGGSSSAGQAGFTLAAVPYTFFVYSAGLSLGPTVAELHINKSVEFVLSFWPSLLAVITVFGILFCGGLFAMYKRFERRAVIFVLLGLFVPLAGAIAYSMTSRGTFNVRYTVIAFPYFSIFIGTGLLYLSSVKRLVGIAAFLGVIGIVSVSLHNHFANPRYAKEDIRSAVDFWRHHADDEPLLATGSTWPALRYAGVSEEKRLFVVGGKDIVSAIERVMSAQHSSSVYVAVARDWDHSRETAIRNGFKTSQERSYPGVKIFKIARRRTLQVPESPEIAPKNYELPLT
jgi:4-amino-4-deoxy-L-arabinose transferase-like glycosyltransferase